MLQRFSGGPDEHAELRADSARIVDVTRPGDGHALTGAAEVRRDLLGPLEWCIKGPGPAHRHVRRGQGRPPNVIELQLLRDGNVDASDRGHIDRGAEDGPFSTVPVVAADIDDECIVELALVFDFPNNPANFMVGVGRVGCKNVRLTNEKLLLVGTERLPFLKLRSAVDAGMGGLPRRPSRRGQSSALRSRRRPTSGTRFCWRRESRAACQARRSRSIALPW